MARKAPPTAEAMEKKIHGKDVRSHVGAEAAAAASGAAIGAVMGAAAGPPGIVAGAVIGGVMGVATGVALDKKYRADMGHLHDIEEIEAEADREMESHRIPRKSVAAT